MSLEKEELLRINGGSITAAYITSLVRGINSILELGRSFGTALRRVFTGQLC